MDEERLEKLSEHDANLIDDLIQVAESLSHHAEEVENMLGKTLEVLSRVGNAQPFNVNSIIQRGEEGRQELSRMTQRIKRHVEELEELVRTSALITTSLEINQVLDEVIDTVIQLTGAERVYLMLLKGEDDLTVRAARNNQGEALNADDVTFSRGVIKAAIQDGMPIISTNAKEDDRFAAMESVMRHDLRSVMVIPMMIQGLTIGVFYLDNRLASAVFHKKSIPILSAFANQAAIAIENARLFERVQQSLERTQREVKRLRIQVDEQKVQSQVSQITDSDYFQELADMARNMRRSSNKNEDS